MKPINYANDKCQWILNNTNYFIEIKVRFNKRIFCVLAIHETGALRNEKIHISPFFYRISLLLKLRLKFTSESWSNVGQKWLVLYCTQNICDYKYFFILERIVLFMTLDEMRILDLYISWIRFLTSFAIYQKDNVIYSC